MKRKDNDKSPRHVRLYHWLMNTEARCDLTVVDQAVYIRIAMRYGGQGTNNGSIPCSLLELATVLGISKQTAMRSLDRLQGHGFLVLTAKGAFNIKHRHATEWLLTEFKDDRPGKTLALPSKDFTRWRKSEHGSTGTLQRVSGGNRTGFHKEQSQVITVGYGSTATPEPSNNGSTTTPPLVYQGESLPTTPTGTVQGVAEEAPPPKGRERRSDEPAGGTTPSGPVHVTEALRGRLGVLSGARRAVNG